jgi:hypothetical protein
MLDIWLRLQQVLLFVLVFHVKGLDFKEFLDLLWEVNDQVVLKLLLHELSNRTFDLQVVCSNLFLVLVIIVEDLNKLPLRFVKGLLRQLH